LAVIGERRATSAALAAGYFDAFRRADIGGAASPVLAAFDASAAARVRTSLQVTGYVTEERLRTLKHADPGKVALVRVSGAVTRQVLDGGRETLLASVRDDRRARGWARVTSPKPREFCAMLASRGAVYTVASFSRPPSLPVCPGTSVQEYLVGAYGSLPSALAS